MTVDVEEVRRLLEELSPVVIRIGFSVPPGSRSKEERLFESMGLCLQEGIDAVVSVRPIPEAVKVVEEGRVVAGVDRSSLFTVVSPVLFDRAALDRALSTESAERWANPVGALLSGGGRVRVFSGPA